MVLYAMKHDKWLLQMTPSGTYRYTTIHGLTSAILKDLCIVCRESSVDERERFLLHNVKVQKTVPDIKFCGPITGLQSPAASVSNDDQVGEGEEFFAMGFKITATDSKNKHYLENSYTLQVLRKPQ